MLYARIESIFAQKGYVLDRRPYALNVVGLRARRRRKGLFDDELHVFYHQPDGRVKYTTMACTTDPGTFWLENPMNERGTAILRAGQYVGAYALGLHKGRSAALVQVRPVTVLLDYNRDAVLDFDNGTATTGLFGINLHRASGAEPRREVDRDSAGCQVVAHDTDMELLLALARQHEKVYGNSFTYTLIDFHALFQSRLKTVAVGGLIAASALTAWMNPTLLTDLFGPVETGYEESPPPAE